MSSFNIHTSTKTLQVVKSTNEARSCRCGQSSNYRNSLDFYFKPDYTTLQHYNKLNPSFFFNPLAFVCVIWLSLAHTRFFPSVSNRALVRWGNQMLSFHILSQACHIIPVKQKRTWRGSLITHWPRRKIKSPFSQCNVKTLKINKKKKKKSQSSRAAQNIG